jgi:hypothetical protein
MNKQRNSRGAKKCFVNKIIGLCGVDVVGNRNAWDVMMTVVYRDGGKEKVTEGSVRSYPGYFNANGPWNSGDSVPTAAMIPNRDAARRERDNVLVHMNSGDPVFILTFVGIEAIYAARDFGWHGKTPARLKVRARRKEA